VTLRHNATKIESALDKSDFIVTIWLNPADTNTVSQFLRTGNEASLRHLRLEEIPKPDSPAYMSMIIVTKRGHSVHPVSLLLRSIATQLFFLRLASSPFSTLINLFPRRLQKRIKKAHTKSPRPIQLTAHTTDGTRARWRRLMTSAPRRHTVANSQQTEKHGDWCS
jgi:hypothetical protein